MYKSGNYSYTQDYKVNYEGTLEIKHSEVKEITNKLEVSEGVYYDVTEALNNFKTLVSEEITDNQLNDLKSAGNIKVNLTIPDSVEH